MELTVREFFYPVRELGTFVKECADSLAQTSGHITCIVDKARVIAVSGTGERGLQEKDISDELEKAINTREAIVAERSGSNFVRVLEEDSDSLYNHQLILPIISEGDALGAVLFLSDDKKMGDVERKLAQSTAGFIGNQV